jgi:ATP adenylyltransferase
MRTMPEILWAPWRMEYIERPSTGKPGADIFVDLPAQNDDRKNLSLVRGRVAFVMLNAFPYTNGHLLIAPYRQIADIEGLNDDELLEINQLMARAVRWIRTTYRPDGFNLGVNMGSAAGAGIPVHIHWHIVPRWSGDTNFTTTIGQVRVMPETLDRSYERLREAVERDV